MNKISFYKEYLKENSFPDEMTRDGQKSIVLGLKNVIQSYEECYLLKDKWNRLKPCRCNHAGEWHMDMPFFPTNCVEDNCKCKIYRKVSLKKYTNGMFESDKRKFWWRFR